MPITVHSPTSDPHIWAKDDWITITDVHGRWIRIYEYLEHYGVSYQRCTKYSTWPTDDKFYCISEYPVIDALRAYFSCGDDGYAGMTFREFIIKMYHT